MMMEGQFDLQLRLMIAVHGVTRYTFGFINGAARHFKEFQVFFPTSLYLLPHSYCSVDLRAFQTNTVFFGYGYVFF